MSAVLKPTRPSFTAVLESHQLTLERAVGTTLQINVGKRCNQACHHCHVDAGPLRTEIMNAETVARVIALMTQSRQIQTLDITGGAPELNPHFRSLVRAGRERGLHVIDRCNLTVLSEPGQEDTADFLAGQGVHIIASLPCYSKENVERQRGKGVFEPSIRALRALNALGYASDPALILDLVYNPVGPSLPPEASALEQRYKEELAEHYGIAFNQLLVMTNLPISRFLHLLLREGRYEAYLDLLVQSFNPATVPHLMCQNTLSVSWDGRLFDCDFNQMLEDPMAGQPTLWSLESLDELAGRPVQTGSHCFGCTAGHGSSCGGSLA
ncbi:MAG: arsenosugar biosynthesis radical SAM (seleno)protein ArsS [Gammaproteobacteria bacterium]